MLSNSLRIALVAAAWCVATSVSAWQVAAPAVTPEVASEAAETTETPAAEPTPGASSAATAPASAAPATEVKPGDPLAPAAPKPMPQLVAEAPIQDLGKLQKGSRAETEFVLANRGDAPLKIKSVQPSCGCTIASFDADIAPGATGRVRATLDTTTLSGSVAKSITVLSNDPKTPRLVLTLRAQIVAFVEVSPGFVRLLQVQTQPQQVTAVNLWSGDGTELEVLEVVAPQSWIRAQARRAAPDELAPGAPEAQWRIEVEVTPDAPLGPLTDKLVVRTSHPRQRELEIPLSGFVRPVLAPTPAVADFGTLGRGAPDKSRFVLKLFNFGSEAIELKATSSDLPFITITTLPEEAGRRFRIELRLAPDAPKGKFDGTLRVETSSPTMPVVEIPVRGKIG